MYHCHWFLRKQLLYDNIYHKGVHSYTLNEARYRTAIFWLILQANQQFIDDPLISALDPDLTETLTFTMDCGEYSKYFNLDPSLATLSYALLYDLDNTTLNLPELVMCDLLVTDTGSNNG